MSMLVTKQSCWGGKAIRKFPARSWPSALAALHGKLSLGLAAASVGFMYKPTIGLTFVTL